MSTADKKKDSLLWGWYNDYVKPSRLFYEALKRLKQGKECLRDVMASLPIAEQSSLGKELSLRRFLSRQDVSDLHYCEGRILNSKHHAWYFREVGIAEDEVDVANAWLEQQRITPGRINFLARRSSPIQSTNIEDVMQNSLCVRARGGKNRRTILRSIMSGCGTRALLTAFFTGLVRTQEDIALEKWMQFLSKQRKVESKSYPPHPRVYIAAQALMAHFERHRVYELCESGGSSDVDVVGKEGSANQWIHTVQKEVQKIRTFLDSAPNEIFVATLFSMLDASSALIHLCGGPLYLLERDEERDESAGDLIADRIAHHTYMNRIRNLFHSSVSDILHAVLVNDEVDTVLILFCCISPETVENF